jgi:hypothetical protein
MSPNAAPNAVKQGKQNATETAVTATAIAASAINLGGKCTRRYVLIAARQLRYRSNPVRAGQSIATIATVK